jgi:hypothetical protein
MIIRMVQFQLLVLSWSILLSMVLFSLENVLRPVEVTLDLNIEPLKVTTVEGEGKGFGREPREEGGLDGEGMDITEGGRTKTRKGK